MSSSYVKVTKPEGGALGLGERLNRTGKANVVRRDMNDWPQGVERGHMGLRSLGFI